ncbi:MAG TPA: hypothetical protein DCZ41_05200 [Firmicutes bacterium]|nr:hypothetical protein [Bacillota bacterium]
MRIMKLHFAPSWSSNTYVLGEENEPALLIDPGSNEDNKLQNYLEKHHQGKLEGILLTHGHIDHIWGLASLASKAPIFLSALEAPYLTKPKLNLSYEILGEYFEYEDSNLVLLEDQDEISFGKVSFKVFETPFHTKGSVCYYFPKESALFSGDTLFHLSVGRCDLPGSEERKMEDSLAKLKTLPANTTVYPGHGENTTLQKEFLYNPFLR